MHKLFLGLSLAAVVVLAACSKGDQVNGQAKKESLLVINVLDPELYEDAHIKGSINVPFEQVDEYLTKLEKENPSAELVFYCANYACSASGASAEQAKARFANVWAYEGGMAEWLTLGYPSDGPGKKEYLRNENKKPEELSTLVISAQDLKKKMVEHKLLPAE